MFRFVAALLLAIISASPVWADPPTTSQETVGEMSVKGQWG